jgi:hypothetical protein
MSLLNGSDLKFNYSWTAIPPDNPKVTGEPDSTLFNRNEGYEMLYFINKFASIHDLKNKASGLKAEHLLKTKLPSDIRSQIHVKEWLVKNWDN